MLPPMAGLAPRAAFSASSMVPKWPVGERFGVGKGTRIVRIGDGTSNTLLFSELLPFDQPTNGAANSSHPAGWNSGRPRCHDTIRARGQPVPDLHRPELARRPDTMMYCDPAIPANHPNRLYCIQNRTTATSGRRRSRHSGGVNAAFGGWFCPLRPRLDRHRELAIDGIQEPAAKS